MRTAIIIPARYGSTRFPGKPLALINGKAMIDHVVELAQASANGHKDISVYVATDDARIESHCLAQGYSVLMTSSTCKTGSDRVLEAAVKLTDEPDIIINLQGDAPLTPLSAMEGVIRAFYNDPGCQVATPVQQLSWSNLDRLRRNKVSTPFSGTTVVMDKHQRALWFSKNILPAIRKEDKMREAQDKFVASKQGSVPGDQSAIENTLSPVYQHLGLYGYRLDILKRFVNLPEGHYEALEGLEQLRFLENNIPITCIPIPYDEIVNSGIDSPEDIHRAEAMLRSQLIA